MGNGTIRILRKASARDAWEEKVIPKDFEAICAAVGGLYEKVRLPGIPGLYAAVNHEGRSGGLEYNVSMGPWDFFGPVVLYGADGGGASDCPVGVEDLAALALCRKKDKVY